LRLAVRVGLEHANASELEVRLSKGFAVVTLLQRPANTTTLAGEYVFSDLAATAFADAATDAATQVPADTYRPDRALTTFDGVSLGGTWTLTVVDHAGTARGRITSLALLTPEVGGRCEPPCPADFNRDGGVDGADIEAFFMAWQAADPDADVNQDGGVDGSDVEVFFVSWQNGGC
jgi:hypothetical protein